MLCPDAFDSGTTIAREQGVLGIMFSTIFHIHHLVHPTSPFTIMSELDGGGNTSGGGSVAISDAVVVVTVAGQVLLGLALESSGHWVVEVADVDCSEISACHSSYIRGNLRPSRAGSIPR